MSKEQKSRMISERFQALSDAVDGLKDLYNQSPVGDELSTDLGSLLYSDVGLARAVKFADSLRDSFLREIDPPKHDDALERQLLIIRDVVDEILEGV